MRYSRWLVIQKTCFNATAPGLAARDTSFFLPLNNVSHCEKIGFIGCVFLWLENTVYFTRDGDEETGLTGVVSIGIFFNMY